jgi:hypothetical protein
LKSWLGGKERTDDMQENATLRMGKLRDNILSEFDRVIASTTGNMSSDAIPAKQKRNF